MRTARQMTTGVLVVAAVIASATLLFIAPNYREARDVRGKVADLQARAATLPSRKETVDKLAAEVRQAREHAAGDLKSIPMTADVAGVIRKLSDRIDGVSVVEQTFTAGTPGEAIVGGESTAMAMPLAADMLATFDSVIALIDKAESMSRLVRVCSVRLLCDRGKHKTDVPLLTASIGLEAIYDSQEASDDKP